jgi:hypothetical protein
LESRRPESRTRPLSDTIIKKRPRVEGEKEEKDFNSLPRRMEIRYDSRGKYVRPLSLLLGVFHMGQHCSLRYRAKKKKMKEEKRV